MADHTPSGAAVCERRGGKIGRISRVLLDDHGAADWAVIGGSMLSGSTLVPLTDAALEGDAVVVPYDKEIIDGAPEIPRDRHPRAEDVDAATHYYRERIRNGPPASG